MTLTPGATRSKSYRFDAQAISIFAMGAGDMNPLHHDPDVASQSRFGGIIASGAHMAAVLMGFGATFVSEFGEAVGLEFTYRFAKAIPAGTDTVLTYTIRSAEPHAKLGGLLLTFDGQITDAAGQVYVMSTGKAVIFDAKPSQT
ncbi:MAG: MaoC family dehydratase [Hyphomicrobiaceae bacterium]|nr:MaoC family dehydratase [Hyphomicrobiaceae bacterium]